MSYGFKQCFISSSIDLLLFFVAPICIILFFNFIFLISSFHSIHVIHKSNKKYLSRDDSNINLVDQNAFLENKKRLILFLKLSLLTGMTWIFGILSSFLNNRYSFLWYIFIVFNSFQGLFIFCSYVFNKKPKLTN